MNVPKAGMHTLIITSTVYVNSDMTVLTDPSTRERQCVESILYYLKSPYLEALIVCDNSGFDYATNRPLIDAMKASGKHYEILYFTADKQMIMTKGKGYGEGLMMAHIFKESWLLETSGASVLKVTGRLIVLNFDTITRKVKPGKTYFHRVGRNPLVDEKKVDTRFYYVNKEVFRTWLLDAYQKVDDRGGFYLEHSYYEILHQQSVPYSGFGIPPLFRGTSGSTGLSYSIGPLKRLWEKLINYVSGSRF